MVLYFESVRLRDYQIPGWIDSYLMKKGIKTDPSASAMLTEYLGTDLHKIANELDKLIITLPAGKPVITTSIIEQNIGISKDYNNFELQKAIGEKNILKANMIVNYFADNPKDNPITLFHCITIWLLQQTSYISLSYRQIQKQCCCCLKG